MTRTGAAYALRERLTYRFDGICEGRVWLGPRPAVAPELVPHALAEEIGYERPRARDGSDAAFVELDLDLAAATLAMLETRSQAYGGFGRAPDEALVGALAKELALLGDGARFFSNADHSTRWAAPRRSGQFETRSVSYVLALSDATFDTGVVGVGSEFAFIVWAEEED